ncbi:prepilin-type N-terminal cleavage/methylation domain-containing protein [candidate division WOR-3 bacterium]|uniref:Prepilin-type N-terminal cleavage/methylation domain-containing protein n=1 Tax=candidate division WOR-3 bacterium TaxID=2052148 RepID=A0A937XGX2_UNCW3|nr:prepilin-type N-terminal cleavage/methylation domain-containing protein [candidate division WOR-3 bacterium]
MKGRQGFTLMELLVVLLIIGILSTVALRTIDATRDRGLFDQTTKEMNQLVYALVGNPDLTYDGRRVDFGYYGDIEQLPTDLTALVQSTGDPAWKGPYLRLAAAIEDSSYLYDGWGVRYVINPNKGIITSNNGKYQMTVRIVDSVDQLWENAIVGTITDIDGAAPGDSTVTDLKVRMYYNNPNAHGGDDSVEVRPSAGGFYEISTDVPGITSVPIGLRKLVAFTPTEQLVRCVTVVPRSRTVVDFKFTSSFWNKLRMIGQPKLTADSSGFRIKLINDEPDPVTINWLTFSNTPVNAYMRDFYIDTDKAGYPIGPGLDGTGPDDTVNFAVPHTIAPFGAQEVEIAFLEFYVNENGTGAKVNVTGKMFQFRFSDGSEITVNP